MTSAINATLPKDGDATPQRETRENFATAKSEITALQNKTANLSSTGGLAVTGRKRVPTIPAVGAVAYSSLGTSVTPTAGTVYFIEVFLHRNQTLTGVGVLCNANAGSDKVIVALYASDGQTKLANSALAGTTITGSNTFQEVAFTATYDAVGPGRYWVAVQVNGTTCRLRNVATATYIENNTGSAAGSFGTLPSTITPTTTVTADVGPIAYVYT